MIPIVKKLRKGEITNKQDANLDDTAIIVLKNLPDFTIPILCSSFD